ncbi:site-specific DNA-methyltransferase [Tenacibaculum finnmarkense]|uniref:site-specific DNA-methyltransferase n=1 Tax=Tenacibaculum finnmarkense TaxID=2781243 RepID=UPI001EFB107F|nr:site-specific DNA-methyltransferase [Tenacibaculum finnmarkense]MCG8806318.1 site-specific DNA-methyltransferase [Tenacibaculum finnmarkense]MCG8857527.1 site-specific DNA-methyltransferase [Tenacibaculum finnmarkense]
MTKEENTTQNISVLNKDMDVLKKNFSHCFDKNGNFDFDKFKKELSENEVNFSKESYGMDWLGKSYARLLASDSTTTLLKEDEDFNTKEENKNSENLLIKGDNLEVLKHLSNAYYEKIKMIYIDPPYNTGSDGFVYQDDRKFTVNEFKNLAGVDEDKAKKILNFVDSKSNSHSAWLTFMYPRLYIAKQLLKDDGVIFISIDDNEVSQLKILMDEVFGEENFLGNIVRSTGQTTGQDSGGLGSSFDYVLAYSKKDVELSGLELTEKDLKRFDNEDDKGKFAYDQMRKTGSNDKREDRPKLYYSIENPDGEKLFPIAPAGYESCWRFERKTYDRLVSENYILWKKSKRGKSEIWWPYVKYYLEGRTKRPSPLWDDLDGNKKASRDLRTLFKGEKIFDFPKPTQLIKRLIEISPITSKDEDEIILDFFGGSGTTGDAVMQLNTKDNGTRKFILAQLPEVIDKKKNKVAYDFVKDELKVAVPTIFDITKERLIRASKKIQEENKEAKIDLGFKVFETTPIWEDYNLESDTFNEKLQLFDELQLTKEDIKSLLITWKTNDGIALTNNLEEIDLGTYTAYYFEGKLYLMDKDFTTNNLKILLELIDTDKKINPASIIAFGYHFESKNLREISENIKSYANKKNIDIDFITRY